MCSVSAFEYFTRAQSLPSLSTRNRASFVFTLGFKLLTTKVSSQRDLNKQFCALNLANSITSFSWVHSSLFDIS